MTIFTFRHRNRNELDPELGVDAALAKITKPQFSLLYGATVQPNAGAMAYAFESYSLPQYPPSGPSVATRTPIRPTTQPMYATQAIPMVSYGGIVAGQMVMQPLFNPYGAGYSGDAPLQFAFTPNAVDPSSMRRRAM